MKPQVPPPDTRLNPCDVIPPGAQFGGCPAAAVLPAMMVFRADTVPALDSPPIVKAWFPASVTFARTMVIPISPSMRPPPNDWATFPATVLFAIVTVVPLVAW